MEHIIGITRPIPVVSTAKLASRRAGSYIEETEQWDGATTYLKAWQRSGRERDLQAFVSLCGAYGTFTSDFEVVSQIDQHHRDAHKTKCIECKMRLPKSSFRPSRLFPSGHSYVCLRCESQYHERKWWKQGSRLFQSVEKVTSKKEIIQIKNCPACHRPFVAGQSNQVYCSKACKRKGINRRYYEKRLKVG